MVYNRYMSQQQGRLEEAAVEEGVAVVDWMYSPLLVDIHHGAEVLVHYLNIC